MPRRSEIQHFLPLFLAILFLLAGICTDAFAQKQRHSRRAGRGAKTEIVKDTVSIPDSVRAVRDSIHRADSIFRADSIEMLRKSSLDAPVFTGAKDSIVEVFSEGQRKIYYYGDVTAEYGNMKLTADYMEFDLQTNVIYARGTTDSSGVVKGAPVLEQGNSKYEMEEVRYNIKSQKMRITNVITQEADGILHGHNMKMMPDRSINITDGKYTVCDCEHPHYYMKMSAAKVITRPSQKTVFGPSNIVVEDVPLPVGLPFGFLPKKPDRATGFLMPTFGEENARGFYMRDAGMYFVIGDYFDISLTGTLYTLGSWGIDVNSRYKVNYKFNGNFGLTYSVDQTGEKGAADFFQTKNFALKWNHSQDAKMRPGTTFSASVNFTSPSNSKYNSRSVTEALQSQTSSSISYGKNWNGKLNLSLNALHSQNSRDSSYSFTLPSVNFSVSRLYPFKRKNRIGKERAYEKISFGYSTAFQNKINFKASEFGQDGFWDKLNNGMNHNFQIGLPNFTLLKYLNFTPSLSYGMNWFFRKTEKEAVTVVDEKTGKEKVEIVDNTSKVFSTFGATHTYSGAISMSTRLYGMYLFPKQSKVQAVRHVITPSISANFSPEKGTYFNGWRTLEYVDETGQKKSLDYNIYAGQINSVPGKGKTGSASLSIGNNLEAKVRDYRDTTGSGMKKVKLIDNLSFNTSYNFLADSLKMSNVGVSLSTSIFGKLGINGNLNFDPYAINDHGQKINKYYIQETGRLLRLTNASASLSYSINGEGKSKGSIGGGGSSSGSGGSSGRGPSSGGGSSSKGSMPSYERIYYHPITGEYIPGGYLYYMNTDSPWSVNFNYSLSYSKSYQYLNQQLITKNNYTQTLGISGNVKLTHAFAMNLTSGFDLMALRMTTTQLSATYDLHCFNISVSWVPSGQWSSYSFRISANAAALADLLRFKKSSSYWDNGQ